MRCLWVCVAFVIAMDYGKVLENKKWEKKKLYYFERSTENLLPLIKNFSSAKREKRLKLYTTQIQNSILRIHTLKIHLVEDKEVNGI